MKLKAIFVNWPIKIGKIVGLTLGYILLFSLIFGFVGWTLIEAANLHVAAGVAVAIFWFIAACIAGSKEMSSVEARGYSVWKGLRIFLLILLVGVLVFSHISFVLEQVGWAKYEPEGVSFDPFFVYYVWAFVDMLPGLEVSETLNFKPPIEPVDSVAGLPVLFFRIFVILGIIRAFQVWWSNRFKRVKVQQVTKGIGEVFDYNAKRCPYCNSLAIKGVVIYRVIPDQDRKTLGYRNKWQRVCLNCKSKWIALEKQEKTTEDND